MPSVAFSTLGIFIYNNFDMLDLNTRNILTQIKDYRFIFEQDDLEQQNLDKTNGNLPKDNAFFQQMQEELSAAIKNNTVLVEYLRVDTNNPNDILVSSAGSVGNINFTFTEDSAYISADNLKLTDQTGTIVTTLNVYWNYKFSAIVKSIKEAYNKNSQ